MKSERRGTRAVKDSGMRTRLSDHAQTPHSASEWLSTFHLRWLEHTKRRNGPSNHHAA